HPYDQEKYLAELNQTRSNIIDERNIPEIDASLPNKLINLKKMVYENTKKTLGKSFDEMTIKENTQNGWSPTDDKRLAILPISNLKDAYNEKDSSIKKS